MHVIAYASSSSHFWFSQRMEANLHKSRSLDVHATPAPGQCLLRGLSSKTGEGITHRFRVRRHTLLKSSIVSPCPKGSEQCGHRTHSAPAYRHEGSNGEFTDPSFWASLFPWHWEKMNRRVRRLKVVPAGKVNSVRVCSSSLFAVAGGDGGRRVKLCPNGWRRRGRRMLGGGSQNPMEPYACLELSFPHKLLLKGKWAWLLPLIYPSCSSLNSSTRAKVRPQQTYSIITQEDNTSMLWFTWSWFTALPFKEIHLWPIIYNPLRGRQKKKKKQHCPSG